LGATFDSLSDAANEWACVEPVPKLCEEFQARLPEPNRPPRVPCDTSALLASKERFNTVLSVDVLESLGALAGSRVACRVADLA